LDVTHSKIYFTSSGGTDYVGVVNLDGTSPRMLITSGVVSPKGIGLDIPGGKLYWSDAAGIKRANLDGTTVQTVLSNLTTVQEVEVPSYSLDTVGTYDPAKTLTLVPLTDTFDSTKFAFVSASVVPDSQTPAGTLTWNNVGPINPAMNKTITVTLKALQSNGNGNATSIPNTATATASNK
jgi:hypothetical protein